MYKNVCHKIIVYVLVGCLSFGVPATTYYNSVHAFEWVGGALAFEEALKWLLAIVGVTVAGSVASQVDWSDVRDQCVEVQLQNGASQAQVSEWWAKLARGTLDKASSCWSSFKEWAQTLVSSNTSESFDYPKPISDVCDYLSSKYGMTWLKSLKNYSSISSYNVKGFILEKYSSDYDYYTYLYLFEEGSNIYLNGNSINSSIGIIRAYYLQNYYDNSWSRVSYFSIPSSSSVVPSGFWIATSDLSDMLASRPYFGYDNYFSGSGSVTSDWQSAIDVAKQNLELLNRDLPDENASEVAIPMPGIADSDNEASSDAYDNIIDAINDGTITLDDGIAQIQDLLHVLVIDDTTDIVQPVRPDPDTGEPEKKDDVIKENKSNMGFTLAGLEKVFPFCIPFDIYAFLTLLVAEPVAPEFDFPIKSVNNKTEEIHIDLSPFEPVAVVVRYIFDFLFIIGLALMTRSLIGGGSSD